MKNFLRAAFSLAAFTAFSAQNGEATGQMGGDCMTFERSGVAEYVQETSHDEDVHMETACTVTAAQVSEAIAARRPIPSAPQYCGEGSPEALAQAESSFHYRRSLASAAGSTSVDSPQSKPPEGGAAVATADRAPAVAAPPPPPVAAITEAAARQGLVDDAGGIVADRERASAERTGALISQYQTSNAAELSQRLANSERELREMAQALERSRADSEESRRLANLARDAADRAQRAREWVDQHQSAASADDRSASLPLLGPSIPWAGSPAMASLFAPPSNTSSSLTADEYARQLALMSGLSPAERDRLLRGLDTIEITLADGRRIRVPRLGSEHGEADRSTASASGIGGGRHSRDTALPCAAFLASALPDELSRSRLTTLDWVSAFRYRQSGTFPGAPAYTPARRGLIEDLARHFDAIDPYRGQRPVPGDLIIHRRPHEDGGRLLMVRNYDPDTGDVEAMEFSPLSRRPANVNFQITERVGGSTRLINDLFVLRIRQGENGRCELHAGRPSSDSEST